jgi:uncharacterized protein
VGALYLDTSGLGQVVTGAGEARAVVAELGSWQHTVGSRLLWIELRRLGRRAGNPAAVEELLGDVAMVPVDDAILADAERLDPPGLGTLDAIHLATALRLHRGGDLGAILTYDRALADAAGEHGIEVVTPRR